jgi:hypothetical protein
MGIINEQEIPILPRITEPQPDPPLAITMEAESVDPALVDTVPAPRETINDIWRDLRLVVFKLEGVYVSDAVAEATKLFRQRLRDELADWVGGAR